MRGRGASDSEAPLATPTDEGQRLRGEQPLWEAAVSKNTAPQRVCVPAGCQAQKTLGGMHVSYVCFTGNPQPREGDHHSRHWLHSCHPRSSPGEMIPDPCFTREESEGPEKGNDSSNVPQQVGE